MEHRVMPIGKMKKPIVMNPMSMIMPIMISILRGCKLNCVSKE